jgi:predicted Rossmann fold nucleotide-binding protein DprA/Smf involved in DNA uptake
MMQRESLPKDDSRYPAGLTRYLGPEAPDAIFALGNVGILKSGALALFCSVKCPGNQIVQTYNLAHKWRNAGEIVISGFHSPMEKECLRILLCSPHPVILCPARSLPKRAPLEWRRPLDEGRLLVLSAFSEDVSRATVDTAPQRNRFVAALADKIFVAYAEPNSKTEYFCRELVAWGKPLYTLGVDTNQNLLSLGAKAWAG